MNTDQDLQTVNRAIEAVEAAVTTLAAALRADSSTFYLPAELAQLNAAVDVLAIAVRRLYPAPAIADYEIPF